MTATSTSERRDRDLIPISRAIVSVYDKTGLAELAAALVAAGVDAVHLSAREPFVDQHPAGPGGGAQELDATSLDLVEQARRAIHAR